MPGPAGLVHAGIARRITDLLFFEFLMRTRSGCVTSGCATHIPPSDGRPSHKPASVTWKTSGASTDHLSDCRSNLEKTRPRCCCRPSALSASQMKHSRGKALLHNQPKLQKTRPEPPTLADLRVSQSLASFCHPLPEGASFPEPRRRLLVLYCQPAPVFPVDHNVGKGSWKERSHALRQEFPIWSCHRFAMALDPASRGEVAEWSNAAVLKTVERESVPRVRIPVSPPLIPVSLSVVFSDPELCRNSRALAHALSIRDGSRPYIQRTIQAPVSVAHFGGVALGGISLITCNLQGIFANRD